MRPARIIAAVAFVVAVLTGTWLDRRGPSGAGAGEAGEVMVADLHVHPYPGDGSLTLAQLQREAARRGVDVVAVTGHNNRFGLRLGEWLGTDPEGAILIPGQELTAAGFHMAVVGIERLVDWRLSAREAIEAIHAQGGVAIAAHPVSEVDAFPDDALAALDGVEVAHPVAFQSERRRRELDEFFARARSVNPGVAPIGSTDFHMTAPLGLCRTYLLVDERTAAGALDAIRRGRTVAADPGGRLFGAPDHVARVERYLAERPPARNVPVGERLAALAALLALAAGVVSSARDSRIAG